MILPSRMFSVACFGLTVACCLLSGATAQRGPAIEWGVDLSAYGSLTSDSTTPGFVENGIDGIVYVVTTDCSLLLINSADGAYIKQVDLDGGGVGDFVCSRYPPVYRSFMDLVVYASNRGDIIGVTPETGELAFKVSVEGTPVNLTPARPGNDAQVAVVHNTDTQGFITYIDIAGNVNTVLSIVADEPLGTLSAYIVPPASSFEERYVYGVATGNLYRYQAQVDKTQVSTLNLLPGQENQPFGNPGSPSGPTPFSFTNSPQSLWVSTAEKTTGTDPNPQVFHWNYAAGSIPQVGQQDARIQLDNYIDGSMMYFKIAGGEGICFAVGATKFRCMSSRLELLWENSYGSAASLFTESAVLSSENRLAVHNDLRGSSTLRGLDLLTGVTDWTLDCADYADAGLDCQTGDDSATAKYLALSLDELYVFFNPKQNWLFKSNVKLTPTPPPSLAPVGPLPTLAPAGPLPTLAPAGPLPTLAPAAVPASESPSASPTSSGTVISVVGSIACVVIGLSMLM